MGNVSGKKSTNVYLPEDLRHGLNLAAAVLDSSVTAIVEDLVRDHLDAYVARKQAERKSAAKTE